jgi:hypothetical protein
LAVLMSQPSSPSQAAAHHSLGAVEMVRTRIEVSGHRLFLGPLELDTGLQI